MTPLLDLRAAYLDLKEETDAAMARVAVSGWYVLGAEVTAFEKEVAAYCGTKHCVGLANGLEARGSKLRAIQPVAAPEPAVLAGRRLAVGDRFLRRLNDPAARYPRHFVRGNGNGRAETDSLPGSGRLPSTGRGQEIFDCRS